MDADGRAPQLPGLESATQVGRGAGGSVWKAWQPRFSRWVAVKVVHEAASQSSAERFARECQVLGGLSGHPYIVTVLDAGQLDDGRPFLTMPYLDGGSFADRLASTGPLTPERALDVGVKVCSALHAAHAAGILHRDVKPENVLMSSYGEPVLADFGVARLEQAALTRTGAFAATPLHAAPEVMMGKRATAASDVYGLGSSLFRLLSGQAAFMEETDESLFPLMHRIANEAPADLRVHGVPDALATVVEQMMAKEPTARPGSALEAGQALQQVQRALGKPVTAAPGLGVDAGVPGAGGVAVPPAPVRVVQELRTLEPAPVAEPVAGPVAQTMMAPPGYQPPAAPPPTAPPPAPSYAAPSYGAPTYQPPTYAPPQPFPPYQSGYPAYGGGQQPGVNGLAVAGFVLTLLWLFWIGSVVGLVLAHVGLRQAKQRGERGRGLAIAALVLGYLGVAFLVIGIIGAAAGSGSD